MSGVEESFLEVHCTRCGAPAGSPCRAPNGKRAYRVHDARAFASLFRKTTNDRSTT